MQEVVEQELCPCGCEGNYLVCPYASTYSPHILAWLESVQAEIYNEFDGGYVDLVEMTGAFIQKICRLHDRSHRIDPGKAAKIILRYIRFMDYVYNNRQTASPACATGV